MNAVASRASTLLLRQGLLYLPMLLLVGVALLQLVLSLNYGMTPWKGGGFGMFASLDAPGNRVLRVWLVTDSREIPVDIPAGDRWEALVVRARTLPTPARLSGLADHLANRSWWIDPQTQLASPLATGAPVIVSAVRVEVLRIHFDPGSREVERVLMADAVRDVP